MTGGRLDEAGREPRLFRDEGVVLEPFFLLALTAHIGRHYLHNNLPAYPSDIIYHNYR